MKANLSKINKRYIGSLVIVPIIISLILGGWVLKLILFSITTISIVEFSNALKHKNKNININKRC